MTTAAEFVRSGLTDILPPGVPLMGQISWAKFTGRQRAEAVMVLFDGTRGTIEVRRDLNCDYTDAWSIHWLELEGGPVNWTGRAWERVAPRQMNLCEIGGLWGV